MKPTDLVLLQVPGRPAITADGAVVVAVSSPDLDEDLQRSALWVIRADPARTAADNGVDGAPPAEPRRLTDGPRDRAPVIVPPPNSSAPGLGSVRGLQSGRADGGQVVFLRGVEGSQRTQLRLLPLDGGESRLLAEHPLGIAHVVASPDGGRLAYQAAVPEPGRYGTDPAVGADAEPPRRIDRLAYRADDKGFVLDKLDQLFVLDLTAGGGSPQQVTNEPGGAASPAFSADGRRLYYVRPVDVDALHAEIAVIDVPGATGLAGSDAARDLAGALNETGAAGATGAVEGSGEPAGLGEAVATARGDATGLTAVGGRLYFCGTAFEGVDTPGRSAGLWSVSLDAPEPVRMTDEETVHVEPDAGPPVVVGNVVLVAVHDRGAVGLRAVPVDALAAPLEALPVLLGGPRVVKGFSAGPTGVAAVVADVGSPGEVVTLSLDPTGRPGDERLRTDLAAGLRATGLHAPAELTGRAPDGAAVHGWLVLPDGPGPHPVLLAIHGGPYSAYTWGLFDEAQVYTGAGYAVVLPNPRGSAGYGQAHGRAVVGRLGTLDADDVLALLDAALTRPDCDPDRVGVMGGSYGGFLTSWLAAHAPGRFRAAISERAVNAWDSFAGSSDIGYHFAEAYVSADPAEQRRASPLTYADGIDIPLLIVHSEHDWRCPVEQAQRLFVALKRRGAPVEMLLFPGEGHELSRTGRPRHRLARFDAILAWWGRHLT